MDSLGAGYRKDFRKCFGVWGAGQYNWTLKQPRRKK